MSKTKQWLMEIEEDFNDMVSDRKSATQWLLGDFKSLHNANHEKLTDKSKEELDAMSDSDFAHLLDQLVLEPLREEEARVSYFEDQSLPEREEKDSDDRKTIGNA